MTVSVNERATVAATNGAMRNVQAAIQALRNASAAARPRLSGDFVIDAPSTLRSMPPRPANAQANAESVEASIIDAVPVEAKPVDAIPAEAEPVAVNPVEAQAASPSDPVGAEPARVPEPAEAAPTTLAPEPVHVLPVAASAENLAETSEAEPAFAPGAVKTIDADTGPIKAEANKPVRMVAPANENKVDGVFHRRLGPVNLADNLQTGIRAVKRNLMVVMGFTLATNALVLAIPVYLFQISDRVLTSRSLDTLAMLTLVIVGAVLLNATLDAVRRFILMRTAVEIAVQLGAPILGAAARASLHSNGKEYQTLGDLQQLRSFLVSGTLLSFLDAPLAPLFLIVVFLVHPHLGAIVLVGAILLLLIAWMNQKWTHKPFAEANGHQSRANLHLDAMSRNAQIINALAMIPEAVRIWGKDTAGSLKAQVIAQDRNVISASISKAVRLLVQIAMLGWGATLSLEGQLTGGMVIAASIIAGRALAPVEGAIEGWNAFIHARSAYSRISQLLQASPLNLERLKLPRPQGRLDVERLLFVPQGTKKVVLNGISFSLAPGDSLAVIGDSGAGKTTLGKMLVGSILPTSGAVRLDLMDLRNWDPRQFGENIGYLPQDVQLFPGTIKANIARMREDAKDEDVFRAAVLADVHELISTFPQGYETVIAADGSPLSGGQKQRIALARTFFGNPRLIVLDEPNSNLDGAGDTALLKALAHAKQNKTTVITITQRPSLLRVVDKILFMQNGTIAMFGTRQDVLNAIAQKTGQAIPTQHSG